MSFTRHTCPRERWAIRWALVRPQSAQPSLGSMLEHLITRERDPSPSAVSPVPPPPAPGDCHVLSLSTDLPVLGLPHNGITQHLALVTSFSHSARCFRGSFVAYHVSVFHPLLLQNTIPLYGSILFCLSIHRLIDISDYEEHCCEHSWTVSVHTHVSNSLAHKPRSGSARSCGNSVAGCLRNYQTFSQGNCTT